MSQVVVPEYGGGRAADAPEKTLKRKQKNEKYFSTLRHKKRRKISKENEGLNKHLTRA